MESPRHWDFLTALIATSDLRDLGAAWQRLVAAGAMPPGMREHFAIAVAEVYIEGEQTGPSRAARVAARLRPFARPAAREPDPDGQRARGVPDGQVAPRAPLDRVHCVGCGTQNDRRAAGCSGCGGPAVDPQVLLVEVGMSSATHTACPACGRASLFARFCYGCGTRLPET
jgi:hypothetical protein